MDWKPDTNRRAGKQQRKIRTVLEKLKRIKEITGVNVGKHKKSYRRAAHSPNPAKNPIRREVKT
jgi:hypothetical protein